MSNLNVGIIIISLQLYKPSQHYELEEDAYAKWRQNTERTFFQVKTVGVNSQSEKTEDEV